MPKYVELILKCGKTDQYGWIYILKLVMWKDIRELFWSHSDTSLTESSHTFTEALSQVKGKNDSQTSNCTLSHQYSEQPIAEQNYDM